MKVLIIEPYRFLPPVNGGNKAIDLLYRNAGVLADITIVSVKSNDASFAKNYSFIPLFENGFFHYLDPRYFFKLKRIIRDKKITHLMAEHPYMGWLCVWLKKSTGVKFICRSQNIEALRFKTFGKWWWRMMWYYEKWVYRQADSTFFITPEDYNYAITNFNLPAGKGSLVTYGIDQLTAPLKEERRLAKTAVCNRHNIPLSHHTLLFNGDLGYLPNEVAVDAILNHIVPLLQQHPDFTFTLFICGRNLAAKYVNQIKTSSVNIIYAGFVDSIAEYVMAADIFINPVVSGGGIKTKLVEALGSDCSAVSAIGGATGIPLNITNGKLKVTADNGWQAFVEAIIATDTSIQIPDSFFEHFYWGNVARKMVDLLESLPVKN